MTLEQIISKYPALSNKLMNTEDKNVKLIEGNSDFKLYAVLNSDKTFQLKERDTSVSCEELEDISDYIAKQYPIHKGDILDGTSWLDNKVKVLAENNNAFVFEENGRYGVAYTSFLMGREVIVKNKSLDEVLKLARDKFKLYDRDYLYATDKKIYEIQESKHEYLILRELGEDKFLFVVKNGYVFNENKQASWTYAKEFETLETAQSYVWQLYDMEYSNKLEMLCEKIKQEHLLLKKHVSELKPEEILSKINQIHAMESIKNVFDSASGVVITKASLEYLLDTNISAIYELSKRLVNDNSVDFHIENVNTAIEEIQREVECKEYFKQDSEQELDNEFEMELG